MLSISSPMKGVGHASYYLDLAQEDYYTSWGNEAGRWFGRGAEALGLTGKVDSVPYKHLLYGHSPDGKTNLVQNAGDPDRQCAWDLTFSAPKPASLLWALGSERVRAEVEAAHRSAVQKALSYVEKEAGFTRRGKAGVRKEQAALVFATFFHFTSRALDPQVHTHCVLINVSVRADKTTGALRSLDVFRVKMTAGALYRVVLAHELKERLSVNILEDKVGFQVEGIPKNLCKAFSTRRAQVERVLLEKGLEGGRAAKGAAKATRPEKVEVSREKLLADWNEKAKALGWNEENAKAVFKRRVHQASSKDEVIKAFSKELSNVPDKSRTLAQATKLAADVATAKHADTNTAKLLLDDLRKTGSWRSPSEKGPSKAKALPQPEREKASKKAHKPQDNFDQSNAEPEEKPHRFWTASKISDLDPRNCQNWQDVKALQAKYRKLVETREILNPIVSEPMPVVASQKTRNESFAKDFSKFMSEIRPEKATLAFISGVAVRKAHANGADAWTLFYTIRNLTRLADENIIQRAARAALRASTYKNIFERVRSVFKPANKWGEVVWQKNLFFADLCVQKRRLFPSAPAFSPLREIQLPVARLKAKAPDWMGLLDKFLEPKEETPKPIKPTSETKTQTESRDRSEGYSH